MNTYYAYMAEQIADEIKNIDDPLILYLYLRAIVLQRCKIGCAPDNTCKGCLYGNVADNCRTLYRIGKDEVNDSAFDEI